MATGQQKLGLVMATTELGAETYTCTISWSPDSYRMKTEARRV